MRFLIRTFMVAFLVTSYFILAPVGYLTFTLWSLLPTRHPERRARVLLAIQRRAFRLMHWCARHADLIGFSPTDVEGSAPITPSIIVANHPTLTDTTAILSSFPNTVTVVKPALFHRWWAKPLFQSAGFIESPGTDLTRLEEIIATAESRLQQGFNVLIFPEGTRSPEGKLHPFGRTAFEIACRAKVPIVPIAIRCEPVWLSKEHPIHRAPPQRAMLDLNVLEAIHPRDYDFSSRALRKAVQERITKNLAPSISPLPA